MLPATVGKSGWRGRVGHVRLVHLVARAATKAGRVGRRQRRLDTVHLLRGAPDLHEIRAVVAFLQMGEPVVGHELDPEGGEHIEEGRLLVIAVGVLGVSGLAMAVGAGGAVGLDTGKEFATDDLGIGGQERQAVAMPIAGDGGEPGVGEGGLELDVPRERHAGRPHQGIADVVADSREGPRPDEVAAAELGAVAAHRFETRQAHLAPGLERPAGAPVPRGHVLLERAAVVEQVELDQLGALVLEIDERTVDPAEIPEGPERLGPLVPGGVIVPPIDPRHVAPPGRVLAAAAAGSALLNLAQEPAVTCLGDGADSAAELLGAAGEAGRGALALLAGRGDQCEERHEHTVCQSHVNHLSLCAVFLYSAFGAAGERPRLRQ